MSEPSGLRPDRPGPAAAYAVNWRTVLAVDAGMGLALVLVGLVVAVKVNGYGGAAVGLAGSAYISLVARRARWWARLRHGAELD